MSKEVATKETARPPLVTGGRIKAIVPENIEQAYRLASAIAAANMAPKAYNRDANAIMVGILHGMEVGFTPMAALQSIAVINGTPQIWGDGALGLVRASGFLEEFKETTEGEGDQAKATCWVKRKGEEGLARSFSVDDAKKAELWDKRGPWQTYPQRMLQMRARSWALRDGFSDVLRGLHIAEEAQDMGNLYQAADGSYVPEERPLREHYVKQAEARQRAAEPDLDAEHRRVTTGYIGDEPEDKTESARGETEGATDPEGEAAAVQGRDVQNGQPGNPAPAAEVAENGGQSDGEGDHVGKEFGLPPENRDHAKDLAWLKETAAKAETDESLKKWLAKEATEKVVAGLPDDKHEDWLAHLNGVFEALGAMA